MCNVGNRQGKEKAPDDIDLADGRQLKIWKMAKFTNTCEC